MTDQDLSKATNPDLPASLIAIKRAAAMARKVAMDTDTGIVIVRDGKTVCISAEELRAGAR